VRGLNTNARAAFEQPIGRIPGEQDLAWDAVSITQIQRIGRENSDFGNVFVRGNVVRLLTRPVPVTSAIVRISSVCRSFTAGRPLRRKRSLLRHHFAQTALAASARAVRHLPETLLEHQTPTSAFPFASSRDAHSRQTPVPAAAISSQPVAEGRSRAGKPELPAFVSIRVHSWFNVTPAFPSRLRVFAWDQQPAPPSPQRQSADSRSQRADLGLESTSYLHSRSFVVHSASGGVSPLVTALTSVLWLQPQRRAAPSPSGETELSRHPRHATAVDGDSDLPLPYTRDATTVLYSTAYDDNWAESELRTQ